MVHWNRIYVLSLALSLCILCLRLSYLLIDSYCVLIRLGLHQSLTVFLSYSWWIIRIKTPFDKSKSMHLGGVLKVWYLLYYTHHISLRSKATLQDFTKNQRLTYYCRIECCPCLSNWLGNIKCHYCPSSRIVLILSVICLLSLCLFSLGWRPIRSFCPWLIIYCIARYRFLFIRCFLFNFSSWIFFFILCFLSSFLLLSLRWVLLRLISYSFFL